MEDDECGWNASGIRRRLAPLFLEESIMSKYALYEVLGHLPYNLKNQIEGYVVSVEDLALDIFSHEGIDFSKSLLDNLLFLAGMWRLWTLVDTYYWIMDNSISLVRTTNVHSIRIGSSSYTYDSRDYRELHELRQKLLNLFAQEELSQLTEARTISDLLIIIKGGEDRGYR